MSSLDEARSKLPKVFSRLYRHAAIVTEYARMQNEQNGDALNYAIISLEESVNEVRAFLADAEKPRG